VFAVFEVFGSRHSREKNSSIFIYTGPDRPGENTSNTANTAKRFNGQTAIAVPQRGGACVLPDQNRTSERPDMPDHPNHVTEARNWLKAAEDAAIHLDGGGEVEALVSQRNALIGIGHAILALAQQLYDDGGGSLPISGTITPERGPHR
jgi:hypothetical protein